MIHRDTSGTQLVNALKTQPVAIVVQAGQNAFRLYRDGVVTSGCASSRFDHGVIATGYGGSGNTVFFDIKNSWGARWGQAGYIRIQHGQCGVGVFPNNAVVTV